ncbi:MAG: (d)CMP kinase [Candidatus Omnitrophica bacterium]|nr:(d)CMP kinase [Candidatus Omnitrophota bacterium]
MIIAIDGPAGAGKSTVARCVAKELGFVYLDTGAMYRALTLKALDKNINLRDVESLVQMCKNTKLDISNNQDGSIKILLDGEDVSRRIRLPQVTQYVSDIAKIRGVRKEMLKLQRSIGLVNNSLVDGRDIGTVVFPNADRKFYIDAEFNQRVKRRFKELQEADSQITLKEVEFDLKNRDHIDSTRSCAPLRKADDALCIDTTNMTIAEVVKKILDEVR